MEEKDFCPKKKKKDMLRFFCTILHPKSFRKYIYHGISLKQIQASQNDFAE